MKTLEVYDIHGDLILKVKLGLVGDDFHFTSGDGIMIENIKSILIKEVEDNEDQPPQM